MKRIIKFTLFILFSIGLSFLAGHIGGTETGLMTASLLGVLITGAGVQTTFAGQAQLEQYIVIGDVDTTNPLQGIAVEVDGNTIINIQSAPLITAFMKWQMETVGAVVGLMLKVATGMIPRNATYRFTNAGATTPSVFVSSDAPNGVPILATTKTININSFEDFSKFSALFLTIPANVSSVEIVYNNGHKATLTITEVNALFALNNQAEADGLLGACSVIDNTKQEIKSVRVFAGATAVTVLIAKLPNAAFDALSQ